MSLNNSCGPYQSQFPSTSRQNQINTAKTGNFPSPILNVNLTVSITDNSNKEKMKLEVALGIFMTTQAPK